MEFFDNEHVEKWCKKKTKTSSPGFYENNPNLGFLDLALNKNTDFLNVFNGKYFIQ